MLEPPKPPPGYAPETDQHIDGTISSEPQTDSEVEEEDLLDDDSNDDELNSIVLSAKGTTYNGHQGVLERLGALCTEMFSVPVCLQPEPNNTVDKNYD